MAAVNIPAAQYLRMSTEHQQYSIENQARSIQQYAESRGFTVVRTYFDSAKSGLWLKGRPGLRELLRDVASGSTDYRAVLVYDVSRWGRFQDTDEAAHYEFLCRSAGIPVHFCAETFANDGSLPSSIMKAIKRVMAGEYSRELGVKVFAGQKRLAELGFKQGGPPGLGYRRLLVSEARNPKQILAHGERKSIATDRVTLVPAPAQETELVREIYRLFTVERMGLKAIARELSRRGVPSPKNANWTHSIVRQVLSHPRYVGCNVFNQTTRRLGGPWASRPRSEWIITPGAHQGIVNHETFAKAQEIFDNSTIRKTDERILRELRSLLDSKGRLTPDIIDSAVGMASSRTYGFRFGGLLKAYELIGYKPKWKRSSTRSIRPKS
jgi:DNA invertase Pin-like site-specific DNA recombinase